MRRLAKMSWLEFKLFARDPLTLIFTLAVPLIVLFIMGQVFGNTPDPEGKVYRGHGAVDV
jgi:ABC-2 type transport system permease protein